MTLVIHSELSNNERIIRPDVTRISFTLKAERTIAMIARNATIGRTDEPHESTPTNNDLARKSTCFARLFSKFLIMTARCQGNGKRRSQRTKKWVNDVVARHDTAA